MKKTTLSEIADRIDEYLNRFERSGDAKNDGILLVETSSWASGRWVYIQYSRYKAIVYLSRTEAQKYLAWLDAGNVGKHFDMDR